MKVGANGVPQERSGDGNFKMTSKSPELGGG
jgi:hypothetical protein